VIEMRWKRKLGSRLSPIIIIIEDKLITYIDTIVKPLQQHVAHRQETRRGYQ